MAGIALSLSACSEAAKYRVLSFFLDGVPRPESLRGPSASEGVAQQPPIQPTPSQAESRAPVRLYAHQPYSENRCQGCHNPASGQLIRPIKDGLCLTCHGDVAKARYLHGPVVVNACDACHLHHTAPYPALLRQAPTPTCLECHQREDLTAGAHHQSLDTTECTACHDPHQGDDRFFVRRSLP